MAFSISFPKVLRRTMGLKNFGELYNSLLGLGIIVNEVLKCEGHNPNSKHISTILIIFPDTIHS